MEKDLDITEIFNFDKREIERYMLRTLKLKEKFKKSFNYIFEKLAPFNVQNVIPKDLEKLTWDEGKNYKWLAISFESIQLIIRKYSTHFTIFYKFVPTDGDEWDIKYNTRYGCFDFHSNRELMDGKISDMYCEDNFLDINKYLKPIFAIIKEDKAHAVWNPYSLKLKKDKTRPKHIEVKNFWDGGEDISNINMFIFALEELFETYLEIFSETDLVEHIKTLKKGDIIGDYTVVSTATKVKDDYFHAVGITMKNNRHKDKAEFHDVYSLTRYYYNDVFNIKEKENA